MGLKVISRKEIALCAVLGAGGAIIFLFAFPKGAISTLVHEVLHLPRPGAGIALIFGPFLALVAVTASGLSRARGGGLIAALLFAAVYALVVRIFRIPTDPKGAFGSLSFVAAVALLGLTVEVVRALANAIKQPWRCLLTGALANMVLLVFYWLAIFPRTAGWVEWKDVPLLLGTCILGGVVAGYMGLMVSRALSGAFAQEQKE